MKLLVNNLTEATSKTGKQFWWVKSGENSYSLWDSEVAGKIAVGQTYDFEVKTNGGFNNIEGFVDEPVASVPATPAPVATPKPVVNSTSSSYEVCNAMNNATAIWVASVTNGLEVKPWQELYQEILELLTK